MDIVSLLSVLGSSDQSSRRGIEGGSTINVEGSFLLAFCEVEMCVESLLFLMAIDKFRNIYGERRLKAWKTCEELEELGASASHNTHEKLNVSIDQVKKEAYHIWDTFLAPASKLEISCLSGVKVNIKRRLEAVHVFGPETFTDALKEPKRTIYQEIWPRFLLSDLYKEMQDVVGKFAVASHPSQLTVSFPQNAVHVMPSEDMTIQESVVEVAENIDNYFKDPLLYGEFLGHLHCCHASENLLFLRSIDRYESFAGRRQSSQPQLLSPQDRTASLKGNRLSTEAREQAWMIFKFFIRKHACFEVCTSQELLDAIVTHIANPHPTIFDAIKIKTFAQLKASFGRFKASSDYQEMIGMIVERENARLVAGKKKRKSSAFAESQVCIMC